MLARKDMEEKRRKILAAAESAKAVNGFTAEDLLQSLGKEERRLRRRHGVHLHVDKVTNDGLNALCSCYNAGRSFWRVRQDDHEIVHLAHIALKDLSRVGIRPLITVVYKEEGVIRVLDPTDPFGARTAMGEAGLDHLHQWVRPAVPTPQTAMPEGRNLLNSLASVRRVIASERPIEPLTVSLV